MSFIVNEKIENILNLYLEIWDKFKELIGKGVDVEVTNKN